MVGEAGGEGAEESAAGVSHVVEADVERDLVIIGEGEDEVGMESGIDGEDDAVDEKAAEDGVEDELIELNQKGDGDGDEGEDESPDEGGFRGVGGSAFFDELGRAGLDDAVANDPGGHEGSDLVEGPFELCFEEDGEADDEPDIAGREEEEAGGGEPIDFGRLGKEFGEFDLLLAFAEVADDSELGEEEDDEKSTGHDPEGFLESEVGEEESSEEKSDSFEGVFGAGEDSDPLHEAAFLLIAGGKFGGKDFDRALCGHLGEVLGDAGEGLGQHDVGDNQPGDPVEVDEGEGGEGDDL